MTLSEFINTMTFGMLKGCLGYNKCTQMSMQEVYDTQHFLLPRVFCADGFNISVQVNHCNYCASENGTRSFGLYWKLVEWGFPSEGIDAKKFNAEDTTTTNSVGGYVEIELMEELINKHGGIDLMKTLQNDVKEI
jgi:hypothetical protein